ncbi:MAG: EamA family transporter [Faecalibacterium sp.]
MSETKQKRVALIYVLLSALLFSTGGLLIKLCGWSAISINGMRSLVAGVFLYAMLKKSGHKIIFNKKVVIGACIASLMNYSFVIATKLTSAGNAIVLQFTQPVFIILFLWLVFKHKPNRKAVLTCAVMFGGIICFFFDQITLNGTIGNLFAIFSGATYAMVFLFKTVDGMDFESSMLFSFFLSFFVCLPFFAMETDYSAANWLWVVLLGIFQMGLAFYFLGKGLVHISPVTASLTSTIEPILNPILVAIFYGETLGVLAIVGAVVVLTASLLYNLSEQSGKGAPKAGKTA